MTVIDFAGSIGDGGDEGGEGTSIVDELAGACSVGSFLGVEAALVPDSSAPSMAIVAFFFFFFLLDFGFGFRHDFNPHLVSRVMGKGILSGS